MSLKGILFDFNGTLFFDTEMHLESFRRVFPKFGKPAPDDAFVFANIFGKPNPTIYRQIFKTDATPEECKEFCIAKEELYYELCLEHPEQMHLVRGAEELLEHLKENRIPYCLATGSGRAEVEFYIEQLGLSRWFDWEHIVYENGSFPGKPAPDCYLLAADRLSLSPADCLVFEDGTAGMRAARAAGVGGLAAVYDSRLASPLNGVEADAVYHDFSDWRSILSRFGL